MFKTILSLKVREREGVAKWVSRQDIRSSKWLWFRIHRNRVTSQLLLNTTADGIGNHLIECFKPRNLRCDGGVYSIKSKMDSSTCGFPSFLPAIYMYFPWRSRENGEGWASNDSKISQTLKLIFFMFYRSRSCFINAKTVMWNILHTASSVFLRRNKPIFLGILKILLLIRIRKCHISELYLFSKTKCRTIHVYASYNTCSWIRKLYLVEFNITEN